MYLVFNNVVPHSPIEVTHGLCVIITLDTYFIQNSCSHQLHCVSLCFRLDSFFLKSIKIPLIRRSYRTPQPIRLKIATVLFPRLVQIVCLIARNHYCQYMCILDFSGRTESSFVLLFMLQRKNRNFLVCGFSEKLLRWSCDMVRTMTLIRIPVMRQKFN